MTGAAGAHILVVDDDPKVRLLLKRCFEGEGYKVSEAGDGAEAVRMYCESGDQYQLVTLDLNLPDMDGFSVAREIRGRSAVPIIMVTGKGDTIDRVVGLELGADDYIAKPFHLREVLARVRAVLRRSDRPDGVDGGGGLAPAQTHGRNETYAFSEWVIDLPQRELRAKSGDVVTLTTFEFQLLEMFVRHANRVLSRDQIMDLLKGHEWTPLDRSIDNMVAKLRKKIEVDPAQPRLLKTVRGVGYSFTAKVRRTSDAQAG